MVSAGSASPAGSERSTYSAGKSDSSACGGHSTDSMAPLAPLVKPALKRGWRDLNTVQFGMTPAHAMTVGPMDTATGSFLDLLNGTRGLELLREEGRRMDLPDGHVDGLVRRLARAGLLDDAKGGGPAADALRSKEGVLDRLRPDLASLSLTTSEPGDAIGRLAARRSLRVQIRGAGRVGALVASLLSGAGVGEIDVRDVGRVEPWDVGPGGLPAEAIGDRRDEAARRAARRSAPDRPPRRGPRPSSGEDSTGHSLVIIAPRDDVAVHAPSPSAAEALITSGTPHLYAGVVEGTGIVGPLVLPGETGCAGCLDQGRADRDPAWPRLIAQWRSGSGRVRRVPPCDLALATTVAGLTAAHALAFLDGHVPSSAGARWEVSLPGLSWHARPVWAHAACPCGAAEKGEGEHPSEDEESHETMAEQRPSDELSRKADAKRPAGTWRAHV
ncbi:ThiF family adenylyltransferase [Streptomyces cyaneochromogenes]|uniref:ThiF family adenylyltransferase n=1 Tax=Streptomyces cyaneochromogenes TaxID=2496836 RepID=A0A3S9MNH1_9ACTN|nr:ThiF family adenylyltransferase [Streptomyces cyaneochromogenes]